MSSLRNISVKKLLAMSAVDFNRYHLKLKYLMPSRYVVNKKIKELGELTFGQVAFLKGNISNMNDLAEIFNICFGISESEFYQLKVVEFYGAFNAITKELTTLMEREKEYLSSDPDPQWEEAGINKIEMFGDLNTIISIAKEYPSLKITEVEDLTYSLVYALRLHGKVSGEIEKAYFDIKKRSA